jgi:hypothetical protein
MIYTIGVVGLLGGCVEEAPLAPPEGSGWNSYPDETIGVVLDKQRGEVILQSTPCPVDQGSRFAVALLPDGKAYIGCWVEMEGRRDDYVFVGWLEGPGGERYLTPKIAAYKLSTIKWSETGKALLDASKAMRRASK